MHSNRPHPAQADTERDRDCDEVADGWLHQRDGERAGEAERGGPHIEQADDDAARAKGRLRGKQPKPSPKQEAHPVELYHGGEHTLGELGYELTCR